PAHLHRRRSLRQISLHLRNQRVNWQQEARACQAYRRAWGSISDGTNSYIESLDRQTSSDNGQSTVSDGHSGNHPAGPSERVGKSSSSKATVEHVPPKTKK